MLALGGQYIKYSAHIYPTLPHLGLIAFKFTKPHSQTHVASQSILFYYMLCTTMTGGQNIICYPHNIFIYI